MTSKEFKLINEESNDEKFLKKSNIKADPQKEYWYNRISEIRRWNWSVLASNMLFQVSAMLNPMNPSHFVVNIYYTVFSLFCMIL